MCTHSPVVGGPEVAGDVLSLSVSVATAVASSLVFLPVSAAKRDGEGEGEGGGRVVVGRSRGVRGKQEWLRGSAREERMRKQEGGW